MRPKPQAPLFRDRRHPPVHGPVGLRHGNRGVRGDSGGHGGAGAAPSANYTVAWDLGSAAGELCTGPGPGIVFEATTPTRSHLTRGLPGRPQEDIFKKLTEPHTLSDFLSFPLRPFPVPGPTQLLACTAAGAPLGCSSFSDSLASDDLASWRED